MQPLEAEDPRVIGPYRVLRRLGAGGMGRVYLGRSAGGRTVAVKVVHPQYAGDEQFRTRFRREVEAARRVGGDWTAPVLDADPDAQIPWVATGYVSGPALTDALSTVGLLPEHSVRALGAGLAEALAAVHGLSLVHRDVKPSNVLLTLDGPRLIDFGIARATDSSAALTSTGVSVGSPGYMSPEQILGRGVGGASDVFSLGAVLAFAANGQGPFPGESSASLLYKVVHEEPELDGLEGELREIVAACLAKDPAARPLPHEISGRLAPGTGAAGLVRDGWLPAPLVEQVSRRAVELLDLEAEAEPGAAGAPPQAWGQAPGASGLVTMPPAEFPSYNTPPPGTPHTPPPGASNTPPPGTPHTPPPGAGQPGVPAGYYGPPQFSYGPGQPASGGGSPYAPAWGDSSPSASGSGFSLSTAAGPGRSRRLSCTLALSVAGVLAVGTTLGFVFGLFPGTGGGGGDSQVAAAGPKDPKDSAPARDVPKAFLGTWQGQLTTETGVRAGRLTMSIQQGSKGENVAAGNVFLSPLTCRSLWRLVNAEPKSLVLDARSKETEGQPGCSTTSVEERVALQPDGSLRYSAKDKNAGNPTATLRKLR